MDINIGKISSEKSKEETKKDSNVKQIINNGNVKDQVFIKEVKDLKL